jgi:hypothetical protein
MRRRERPVRQAPAYNDGGTGTARASGRPLAAMMLPAGRALHFFEPPSPRGRRLPVATSTYVVKLTERPKKPLFEIAKNDYYEQHASCIIKKSIF